MAVFLVRWGTWMGGRYSWSGRARREAFGQPILSRRATSGHSPAWAGRSGTGPAEIGLPSFHPAPRFHTPCAGLPLFPCPHVHLLRSLFCSSVSLSSLSLHRPPPTTPSTPSSEPPAAATPSLAQLSPGA